MAAAVIVFVLEWFGVRLARTGTLLGPVRDPGVRGPGRDLILQAGDANAWSSVRRPASHRGGLPRPVRGGRRVGVHHPGLHRLRGGGAAGRGGQGPAAHHPPGGHLLLPGHQRVLRADHLCGHRLLRAGPVRRVPGLGEENNPWDALARGAWGAGWVLFLAIANSAIANANASANAATRTWFALGRIRVLPQPLEHVNPRWRSRTWPWSRPVRRRRGGVGLAGTPVRAADRLRPGRHHRHRGHHRHLHGGEPGLLVFYLREGRSRSSAPAPRPGPGPGDPGLPARSSPPSASRRSTSSAPCRTRSAWSAPSSASGTRSAWCTWSSSCAPGRERLAETGRVFTDELPARPRSRLTSRRPHGGAQLPAGPGGVRLDLRRGAAGPPGPAEALSWSCGPRTPSGGRSGGRTTLVSRVIEFPFVNPQTGPFYVEGPSPATPWPSTSCPSSRRGTGRSAPSAVRGPGRGAPQRPPGKSAWPGRWWMYRSMTGGRCFPARSPDEAVLDPMHGTVGVAPASFEAAPRWSPTPTAATPDTPEMRAGVTCYLGVNVEGALFSVGDGHLPPGEGESCGVAVEGGHGHGRRRRPGRGASTPGRAGERHPPDDEHRLGPPA